MASQPGAREPSQSNARPRRRAFLHALVLVACCALWWQHGPLPLDLSVRRFLWNEQIPGVAISVYRANGSEIHVATGTLNDGSTPVREDTLFSIASLSKPLTAAAVRRMLKRDSLSADSTLMDLLQLDADSGVVRRRGITVRHLLQHTAGLARNTSDDPLFESGHVRGCAGAIAKEFQGPGSAIGSQTAYSNIGYCVLGNLLERREKRGYAEATFHLLGISPSRTPGLVFGYPSKFSPSLRNVHASLASNQYALLGAAGGWFADARTLARILAADAASPSQFDEIAISGPAVHGHSYHYGLGWRVQPSYPDRLSHFGLLPGTFAVAVVVRGKGAAVALFSGSPIDPEQASSQIVELLVRQL